MKGNLRKDLAIWGAGFYGKHAYLRLKKMHRILCFVDNDPAMRGTFLYGVPVVSGEEFRTMNREQLSIVICVKKYAEVSSQIIDMGILDYYVMLEGFLYHNSPYETMMPVEISEFSYHKKKSDEKNILFVQNTACIRTNKIAACMKKCGYKVYLLYTLSPSLEEGFDASEVYDDIFPFSTANGIVDFVTHSEFDIVHSSNEPDFLTALLVRTGKRVVHDCHDLLCLCRNMTTDGMLLEYQANVLSAGNIYPTEGLRRAAVDIFGIQPGKTFALRNYVSEKLFPTEKKNKLSSEDCELHCVYEGSLSPSKGAFYFFEDIWSKIASCGIHVHFYTNSNMVYCKRLEQIQPKYIHYEGNMTAKALASEMSQYDVGLCIYNVTEGQRQYMENVSPNKIHDYVNAGIPVAVGDIDNHRDFLEKNRYGKQVLLDAPCEKIIDQFQEIAKIKIPSRILQKNGHTMESQIPKLMEFYEKCRKGISS